MSIDSVSTEHRQILASICELLAWKKCQRFSFYCDLILAVKILGSQGKELQDSVRTAWTAVLCMARLIRGRYKVRSGTWKEILAKEYRDKLKATLPLVSFICSIHGRTPLCVARHLYTYPPIKFYVN